MFDYLEMRVRNQLYFSIVLICILTIGFPRLPSGGLWANAVSAETDGVPEFPGVVRSEPESTEIKTPLSGNLVGAVLTEGTRVDAGAVIARIGTGDLQSGIATLSLEIASLSLQKAALVAERLGQDAIVLKSSEGAIEISPPAAAALLADIQASYRESFAQQRKVAKMREDAEARQVARINDKLQLQDFIRIKTTEQLTSLTVERARISGLVARGNFPLNKDAELKRQITALEVKLAENNLQKSEFEADLEATRLAAAEQHRGRMEELAIRERDLILKYEDAKNRLSDKQNAYAKTEVRAPHTGTIRNVRIQTLGTRVVEGEVIMELEKPAQSFIVEVVAPATELNALAAGDSAEVRPASRKFGAAPGVPAMVDGIIEGETEAVPGQTPNQMIRTIMFAIDNDLVPLKQRRKFRTGYSVSVAITPPSRRTNDGAKERSRRG